MPLSQEEKERIDYEAKARIEAMNEGCYQWGCAGVVAIPLALILIGLLESC